MATAPSAQYIATVFGPLFWSPPYGASISVVGEGDLSSKRNGYYYTERHSWQERKDCHLGVS